MKLLTWNCAGGLKKKYEKIRSLGADVMVIQECSRAFTEEINSSRGRSSVWFGSNLNPNKGLAVFVREPWTIRDAQQLKLMWAGRVLIDGPASFELFPVWAHKGKNRDEEYIGQIHILLDLIEQTRLSPFAMVIGDFNSDLKWDKQNEIKNHASAVERFRALGLKSAYDEFHKHGSGITKHATTWHLKKKDPARHNHIDYVFLSSQFLPTLRLVEVGSCGEWLPISDHFPVMVELDP